MSLKDDLEAMQRHKENGTLDQWMQGTAPTLPESPWPRDNTATMSQATYAWQKARGD